MGTAAAGATHLQLITSIAMDYVAGDPVDEGQTVTHVGSVDVKVGGGSFGRANFRFVCRPRSDQTGVLIESYVSVYVGRLTFPAAIERVTLGQSTSPRLGDGIRFASAQCLLDAGFKLTHEPEKACEEHVAVKFEGEWDDEIAKMFDACFHEYLR